jgi:ABC-type bacteriocin/lantibiotic exporter with double-glycine peptidase domain
LRNIIKHTWVILTKKEKHTFTRLLLLDILISILDILSLALLLWIIQFYIQSGNSIYSAWMPAWLEGRNSIWFIAVFFILYGIKNLAAFLLARSHYRFISQVAVRLSAQNLSNYQLAAYEEFINIDSSIHTRKISYQPFEFGQFILTGLQQVITQTFLISLTVVAILIFNARLFFILLILLLPPVVVVFYFIKKRVSSIKKDIQLNNELSFQYLFDALKGYVESNIYNRNSFFLDRFINARKKFSRALFESQALQNMPGRIIEVFAILGLFILVVIATWTGIDDSRYLLTIGAFMAAAYKIIPGVVKIINVSGQMKAYEFAVSELATEKMKEQQAPQYDPGTIRSMQLKDLAFQYKDTPLFREVNLDIRQGDFIGITGVSGSGKTTLLQLILGFLPASRGKCYINDSPVTHEQIRKAWPGMAYVRQQGFLIHDTLLKNITLSEHVQDEKKLNLALDISGLDTLIDQSPDGLAQMILENGKNISGGQQQRITLARALYKNADLVLLDEPFNELDEESEMRILDHLRTLTGQGKMIILVTHNRKCLSYCNKILSLDGKP